jgi:hypothetical protein
MKNDYPYFPTVDVSGFTAVELDAVADLVNTPGWVAVQKYLGALMEPVRPAVYSNADPAKHNLLHQGLGAIYVASNLVEFVSSAKSKADLLVQQEESALETAEQPNEAEV